MFKKLKKLTKREKDLLAAHSKNYDKKHVASMRMNIMRGKGFKEAHTLALKKYGK